MSYSIDNVLSDVSKINWCKGNHFVLALRPLPEMYKLALNPGTIYPSAIRIPADVNWSSGFRMKEG